MGICLHYPFLRRFKVSSNTAITIIAPLTICCQYGSTPNIFKPLLVVPIIKAPITHIGIVPKPPLKETPPITAAAIASSSQAKP